VARPSVITPEVRAAIERARERLGADATVGALRAELEAAGVRLSPATLSRYRAGRFDASPAAHTPDSRAADDGSDVTPAALADELTRRYREVRAVVDGVKAQALEGGPALSRWLRSVAELVDLAEALARMVPPTPPDPETDPGNVAAKKRLLEQVDAILARGGSDGG
jgi:hypothetical protein